MKKVIILSCVLLIFVICIIPSVVEAIDVEKYKEIYIDNGDVVQIKKKSGVILGVAQVIGVSSGMVILLVLGAKYMLSSTNDKATIKEQAIPYIIGAVLLFGGTGILTIISRFTQKL